MASTLAYLLGTVLPHLLMAKDKKKHSKKGKGEAPDDLLDVAALSIKKFRKVTKEISKLSTGQKLVGGIALVAAGLAYLAQQDGNHPDEDAEQNEAGSRQLSAGSADAGPADDGNNRNEAAERPARKPSKPKRPGAEA